MTRSVLRLLTEKGRLEKLYYKQICDERNEEFMRMGIDDEIKMAATGNGRRICMYG